MTTNGADEFPLRYGTNSASEAINSGLDLEMPGPSRWRGDILSHALAANKVKLHILDQRVRAMLKFIERSVATGVPENAAEKAADTPKTAELLRKLAADSIVLLKNSENILPLNRDRTASLSSTMFLSLEANRLAILVQTAVIGPNAKIASFSGGGSASLRPYYAVTPFAGIASKVGAENIKYSLGVTSHKLLPLLETQLRTLAGEKGFTFRAFTEPPSVKTRQAVDETHVDTTSLFFADYYHPCIKDPLWWAEVEGIFTPDQDGDYDFGLTVYGTGKLFIDGDLIVDNESKQQAGDSFYGTGTIEEIGTMSLKEGKDYALRILYASAPTSKLTAQGETAFRGGGLRLGGSRRINPDEEIQAAVEIAAKADQVIVCAGLNVTINSFCFELMKFADLANSLSGKLKALTGFI